MKEELGTGRTDGTYGPFYRVFTVISNYKFHFLIGSSWGGRWGALFPADKELRYKEKPTKITNNLPIFFTTAVFNWEHTITLKKCWKLLSEFVVIHNCNTMTSQWRRGPGEHKTI